MRQLEIGSATGRYAHYFPRQGYPVDAVELMERSIEGFRANTQPGETVTVTRGNARKLDFLPSDTYDVALLLGPRYHLFAQEDKHAALSEALRVTKPGGLVFAAYSMADAAILQTGFLKGRVKTLVAEQMLDPDSFP